MKTTYMKQFQLKDCASIFFFQTAEEMEEAADTWGLTPIIGIDGEDEKNFPGVFAALEYNKLKRGNIK